MLELVSESQLWEWGQKGLERWPELSAEQSTNTLLEAFCCKINAVTDSSEWHAMSWAQWCWTFMFLISLTQELALS